MEIVFFWLIGSIVVAIIAMSRRRTGAGWFVLSLLFSPLLMGILVLALGSRPAPDFEQQDGRPRMKCPACAELILAEATKCKHCRTNLTSNG